MISVHYLEDLLHSARYNPPVLARRVNRALHRVCLSASCEIRGVYLTYITYITLNITYITYITYIISERLNDEKYGKTWNF